MELAKMTSKGQLTVPVSIRKKLGIGAGDQLLFYEREGQIILAPVTPASLAAAIAAGLGIAFVMSQIRPVFFDGATLRQVTQLPLLGVVALIPNEEQRRRESRSLKRFAVASVAFLLLYAGGMAALSIRSGALG